LNFIFVTSVFFVILLAMGMAPAFASLGSTQNFTGGNYTYSMNSSVSPITVTANNQSYKDGDRIQISGTTRDYIQDMPITIIIRNPVGNIVVIAQVPLNSDKTYSTTIPSGGPLWQMPGTYEIDVTFGTPDRSATASFQFAGSKVQTPLNTIAVEGTNFTVPYVITNGKVLGMKIDSQSKSLLVAVETTDDGTLTVTLPRAIIDAKAANQDEQYYVLMDGAEADFDETSTTPTERTLSIPFVGGTEEIEIIGTQVVPEFGLAVTLTLAIAITVIVVISTKTRQQLSQNKVF
jgi:predicted secreted protein with PEFG-CTERM motif